MGKVNANVDDSIVPFSVADMEFKNLPQITEALKTYIDSTIFGYTEATQEYYNAVCNWMKKRHDWNVEKEWITEFSGVIPALHIIIRALTEEEDNVLLMTPVYYPFYTAIKLNNRKIIKSELVLCKDHHEIDFEDFERKAKLQNTKLFILFNSHNPVGRVWNKEELEKMGKICIDNNVIVVSDEIHFDLIMPGYKHNVFANISKEFSDHSVTCTAPSKTFNLAGIQLSNMIASNKKIRDRIRVERRKSIGNLD
ncbi:MalY/PatB family protein [Clostridium saccharobutylicum]|uniref:MalY/PatB family protein n=1 Tax=Clostridium saccharobutylicum TaxID=169679 RepID=UPI00041EC9CC|nr:aminotransferase class I/II-fold pyridoxal phosphate-dependent enzyme [Clostridium saccharobutylicum]MBA2907359.1 bifunctional pyridoxal-dependent enzyme with beta-cystathionase and maltose regulon repressor activities [Clostridium saccharobutylicum]MBA8791819.1 bifunctional pyridoxal-dependent enzyme with beta-cystathionase and maltose regulon repressor activities [Clostridium saccharobutylicum]MBA8898625.1 bifunctional pyridoxal-dependent enzyme with beta-cystathionase and maltose regulon r